MKRQSAKHGCIHQDRPRPKTTPIKFLCANIVQLVIGVPAVEWTTWVVSTVDCFWARKICSTMKICAIENEGDYNLTDCRMAYTECFVNRNGTYLVDIKNIPCTPHIPTDTNS